MTPYYTVETYTAKTSIGYLIRRARNLMTLHVEAAFARHEITFMHWVVLLHLRDDLARTAGEIAREMGHDSGALTRIVDHLARRGFIDRKRSAADRRTVMLSLTDSGLALVNSLVPVVVDRLNVAVAGFTNAEIDTLTQLLTRLADHVASAPSPCHVPAGLEKLP